MSSNGLCVGDRVYVLTPGTTEDVRIGNIVEAPSERVSTADSVWVQLSRPLLGRSVVRVPIDRVQREDEHRAEIARDTAPTFGHVLRDFRDHRRLSQSRLAEAAGLDHSYVSRLEAGGRVPTRDAVMRLALAMQLDDAQRDALLASAGFMPGRIENLFCHEPVLSDVLVVLQNREIPADVRDDVRHMISLLVRQAQRAAVRS